MKILNLFKMRAKKKKTESTTNIEKAENTEKFENTANTDNIVETW